MITDIVMVPTFPNKITKFANSYHPKKLLRNLCFRMELMDCSGVIDVNLSY